PTLFVVLFSAYKIVGRFGAGPAVDFLENKVFGNAAAIAPLGTPQSPDALSAKDDAADGAGRLVVVPGGAPGDPRVVAKLKQGGISQADPRARIDVYPAKTWLSIAA